MGKNITIKSKVIIVVSVIIAIITIAAIISSYNIFYKNIFATSKLTQYRVASFLSDIVYEELRSRSLAVKSFVNSFNPNEDRVKLSAVLEEFKNINGVLNVSLAYEDGEFTVDTASINSISEDYDHKVRDWYIEGMKVADIYFSEPYQDTTTGEICLTLTYPIKKEGGVKGLMSVDFVLNVNQYLKNLPNERLDGRLYVVHNSGIIASALNKEHLMKNVTQLYDTALVNYINEKIQTRSMAFSEPQEYNSVSGSTRLGQVMPVRDYDFVTLYGVDKNTLAKDIAFLALKIAIIILVISIMGVIVLYFLLRKILNPLGVFANEIYKMAENKDLSVKLQIHNNDELGFILKAINTLNQSTEDVVSEVRSSIIEVASANNQLAATMEELSATFNSQSQQVSSMVEGMENVSGISKRTSDALSENMLSLETTANATRHETEKLDNVSEKMTVIEQDTVNLSETIRHLSESSAQIGNILNVINDIANQTNLLALNAAIEAARAGEAGRGFAVVADEVRKLAERTQGATKEIENIISELLKDADNASNAMDKSVTSVHEGTTNITNVTTEIKKAVENVTILYQAMSPVADAVSEQYATIQTVVDNTQVIAAGIEESNAAVNEVNNTVSHIQQRTEKLKNLIEQFKTNK
ncbi:methyl-accepting chemotaxis protein [Mucispirillum schaedleri]|uniref:methyl-accepting chemotaxis protein n=1 Tax=Mucispirillum schaedleri TaxID=248039 RepID=UPI001F580A1C|nr:methyl-accepting chemotaxis protein [Mucispirillum schaedleri]